MSRAFKLTQSSVEAAKCPPGKKDALLFDAETRGFGLRITAAGAKVFVAQYNVNGSKRRVRLGEFGVLTVEKARRQAKAVLGDAAKGLDPFAERRAQVEAARAAKAAEAFTFGGMAEQWIEARRGDRRASYLDEAEACLRRNLPEWKDRGAHTITPREAAELLDALKARKSTVAANRTLSYARTAFAWAVKNHRLATNPLAGLERRGTEEERERVLTTEEIGGIWRGCNSLGPSLAGFVRVLMLTAQRRTEVAGMLWSELDDPQKPTVWTIPGGRAKNRRTHVVHLSEPARAIIALQPKVAGCPFVFPATNLKAVAGFSYAKHEITAAAAREGIALGDWRLHDFRRVAVTTLADMGFAPHVCDRLLNHVTGAIQGVARIYQRSEFIAERKAALEAWAEHVLAAAERREPVTNVVQFARAG